jgi:hypothetical protein
MAIMTGKLIGDILYSTPVLSPAADRDCFCEQVRLIKDRVGVTQRPELARGKMERQENAVKEGD